MKQRNIELEKRAEKLARKGAKRGKVRNPNGSVKMKKELDTLGESFIKSLL